MNETVKTIIAYAGLVCGIPLLVAKLIWYVPSAVLAKVLAKIADRLDHIIDAAIEGLISILLACLIFDQLRVPIRWVIPGILIAVTVLWESGKEEAYRVGTAIIGILVGYFLYPGVLRYLVDRFGL